MNMHRPVPYMDIDADEKYVNLLIGSYLRNEAVLNSGNGDDVEFWLNKVQNFARWTEL
jgi:hypothetical protein